MAEHELLNMGVQVNACAKVLEEKSGAGKEFLGWVDLPKNYDKAEFENIKKAAKEQEVSFICLGPLGFSLHSF